MVACDQSQCQVPTRYFLVQLPTLALSCVDSLRLLVCSVKIIAIESHIHSTCHQGGRLFKGDFRSQGETRSALSENASSESI